MLLPRALQLRYSKLPASPSPNPGTGMESAGVDLLVVDYLRKRGLLKALKAFISEAGFKESGELVKEDLVTICSGYLFNAGVAAKKRKTKEGVTTERSEKRAKALVTSVEKVPSSDERAEPPSSRGQAKLSESKLANGGIATGNNLVAKAGPAKSKTEDTTKPKSEEATRSKPETAKTSKSKAEPVKSKPGALELKSKDLSRKTVKSEFKESVGAAKKDKADQEMSKSSSDESSEDDDEDKETKLAPAAVAVVSSKPAGQSEVVKKATTVKASKSQSSSSDESSSDSEVETVTGAKAPAIVVGKGIADAVVPVSISSSSDDSSSDSEDEKQTVAKAPIAVVPKVKKEPVALPKKESSSSSSSDSEDEKDTEVKAPMAILPKVKGKALPLTGKKDGVVPAETIEADASGDESSSESDEEKDMGAQASVAVVPKEKAENALPVKKEKSESEDGVDDSESDEESQEEGGTMKAGAANTKVVASVNTVVPTVSSAVTSSSSDDSSDDETDEKLTPKPLIVPQKSNQKGPQPAAKLKEASSSNSDSSSDDESDDETKKPAVVAQAVAQVATPPAAPHIYQQKVSASSSSSDSDEDEKLPSTDAKAEEAAVKPAAHRSVVRAESSSSSEEEQESSDESVEIKSTAVASLPAENGKASSSDDSSDSSDDSDEEQKTAVKKQTTKVAQKTSEKSATVKEDSSRKVTNQFTSAGIKQATAKKGKEASKQPPDVEMATTKAAEESKAAMKKNAKQTSVKKGKHLSKELPVEDLEMLDASDAKLVVDGPAEPENGLAGTTNDKKRKLGEGTDGAPAGKKAKVESKANGKHTKNGDISAVKAKGGNATPKSVIRNASGLRKTPSSTLKTPTTGRAFQRVNPEAVELFDPRLSDNSYWAKSGAEVGYGAKAQEVLGQVRGKDFRHEKTKKKRGSYKGGFIDNESHSIKFKDSDEE